MKGQKQRTRTGDSLRAALALLACTALAWAAHSAAQLPHDTSERAYSVQLHMHGSFSEGWASIDSHTWEARRAGIDVLWWTDHDWHLTGYKHATRFGFDAFSEPAHLNETWTPSHAWEAAQTKWIEENESIGLASSAAVISTTTPYAGSGCLRLEATNTSPTFRVFDHVFESGTDRWVATLAGDVVIGVAIDATSLGPDARAYVTAHLAVHSDLSLSPTTYFKVRYVLDNALAGPTLANGTWTVPLAFTPGTWNRYSLRVTDDAVTGFAPFDGRDNGIHDVSIGVETRNGVQAVARFDDFSMTRGIVGEAASRVQRRMLAELGREPVQIQGSEVSYHAPHLNVFTPGPYELPDYDAIYAATGVADPVGWISDSAAMEAAVASAVVQRVHALGGVVSYNHCFGATDATTPFVPTRETVVADLLANRAHGADVLEVGYRQRGRALGDFLWVWDRLAISGLPMIGVGVTDSHSGFRQEYQTMTNNFVSWISARSSDRAALADGLARGRVWFGDPNRFDGRIELATTGGHRMGNVVVSDATAHRLSIELDGLAHGDVVTLIRNGSEEMRWTATSERLHVTHASTLAPGAYAHDRVEVHDAGGNEKVFSNHLSTVRGAPPGGLDGRRAAVELGGVRSRSLDGFRLIDASFEAGTLSLSGEAERARIELDVSAHGAPTAIRLVGFEGQWSFGNGLLSIGPLDGTGTVEVVL